MRLVDGNGAEVRLGQEVGRGGEGAVFRLPARPGTVAKVYTRVPDAERADKLALMVDLYRHDPTLAVWCAWPQELLFDPISRSCRGFLMPEIEDNRPIHDLYSPEQRKARFPDAAWDFLVRAAANAARMFAALHRAGVIVGDVNERNLLVRRDATVLLVDCDSFQITRGNQTFLTGVGVVDYTPPELQGTDFRTVVHSLNHDRFGLAVVVFKLLFMGRHPFSGGATGDLAAAIRNFGYDYQDLTVRMRHLVPLGAVSVGLTALFARAFGPSGAQGERPSPEHWLAELATFEAKLEPCAIDRMHRLLQGATRCPWCTIEATLHYAYFPRPQAEVYVTDWSPDLQRLQPIEKAMHEVPGLPDPDGWETPRGMKDALTIGRRVLGAEEPPDVRTWYLRVLSGLVALGGAATLTWDATRGVGLLAAGASGWGVGLWWRRRRRKPWLDQMNRLRRMVAELDLAEGAWRSLAGRCYDEDRKLEALYLELCGQYEGLDAYRKGEFDRLERDQVAPEVADRLARVPLDQAAVAGLSPDKRSALQIRGFHSAFDIAKPRLLGIPGLTAQSIDALVQWRQALEVRLGGTRRPPPTRAQFEAIDANCRHLQEELEQQLWETVHRREQASHASRVALEALYADCLTRVAETQALGQSLWAHLRGT